MSGAHMRYSRAYAWWLVYVGERVVGRTRDRELARLWAQQLEASAP